MSDQPKSKIPPAPIVERNPAPGMPPKPEGEWTAETLAYFFHDTYEMLAPSFGYETREDTREFNPESKNGRLMVAVCGAVLLRFNAAVAAEREKVTLATQMVQIESKRANEAEQTVQTFTDALKRISAVEWSSVEVIKQFTRETLNK